ncbi:RDD family protein [Chitinophaga sp. SYP-B3965]|uniref:RDD family protein n=1 Tax=Chitinophaga sp. SYP-B3965 TaxID=2663120 RepID=UPI0012996695|nr:RDD family protein [Chitinophaga sp. SYP-B3965]MRG44128.1 RDD family protein [Chitinophaga sp. SYP-B3965]
METTQADLLTDEIVSIEQASSGKRLANYLIDLVSFYAMLFIFGIMIGLLFPESLGFWNGIAENVWLDRLFTMCMYAVYMALVEGIFKGRTLGKLITGTRAVNEDGTPISFITGFGRGLIHAVPFCAFSALGTPCYPWHDQWTKTYVVDLKLSVLPA